MLISLTQFMLHFSAERYDVNCQQVCVNKIGSFECECEEGFNLNTDEESCSPSVNCSADTQCVHGTCFKSDGK